jgi:rhodanese-related sulfurtransferase
MTPVNKIDVKQAKDWLDNNEAVIVDVREPGEYAEIHINNATLAPVGTINISQLPEHANKKVIIHCKLGVRGGKACEKLLAEKPDLDVYNLEGGILAWMDAGLPVVKS